MLSPVLIACKVRRNQGDGSTFDTAVQMNGAHASSSSVEAVTLRGYDPVNDTAPTTGLPVANLHESFTLSVVPEPGTLAEGVMGALALFVRRRR